MRTRHHADPRERNEHASSRLQPAPARSVSSRFSSGFDELISFHGGIGGPQTRPFVHHPAELELPDAELIGAAAVHDTLLGWRHQLNGTAPTA